MIDQVLPKIKDSADYMAAMAVFKPDAPLTEEEADKLLAVCARYLPEYAEDTGFLKVGLAVDLLPGRSAEDAEYFKPLKLNSATLDVLFTAQKIVSMSGAVTAENAGAITAAVKDENADLPARVILARVALDSAASARDIASMRQDIFALAAFLTNCGGELMDRCTELVREVKTKCCR